MKCALHYSNKPAFVPEDHETKGIGGTENFAVYIAKMLVKHGHDVSFYNQAEINEPTEYEGIKWHNVSQFNPSDPVDVLVSFRMREVFQEEPAARLKVLILADTESYGLGDDVRVGKIDVVMPVSQWQMDKIAGEEGLQNHTCWLLASNGIDMQEFNGIGDKIAGKCIHLSTPERGLGLLLDVWPQIEGSEILKSRNIAPELHLFSSYMGWGMSYRDNELQAGELYRRIESMKHNGLHIHNYKHVPRPELREHQFNADLLLYPTNFDETYCISLTECMAAGVVPVVSNRAAMARISDDVNGYLVGEFNSDAYSEENKALFVESVETALIVSENTKRLLRESARDTARQHDYDSLVPKWASEWNERLIG